MSAALEDAEALYDRAGGLPSVSLIIPAKNEAQNLPHVLATIPAGVSEVILVDGQSHDGTPDVARLCRPDIRVIPQEGRGKGDALRCGFAAATGDIIVMADADGSTDLTELPRYVQPLLEGADYVKGSRYLPSGGSADITPMRKLGNSVLSGSVNLLFGTAYTDLCYGYNAFWRRCLTSLAVDCDGFEVETLLNIRAKRAGLTVVEVPSFENRRLFGKSNLNVLRDGTRVLRTILRERARRQALTPIIWLERELDLAVSDRGVRLSPAASAEAAI